MAEERAAKRIKTHDGASPSSSSAAAPEFQYQVFLSFRGEDTRKSFTDHLYCYLRDAGIRTFRDNEELRIGNEIGSELLRAIEESSISIPIISRGYASSKWCLTELSHMLKYKKTNNTGRFEVCPIFYDVSPSDCKLRKGCFAEAFVQHSKDFDKPTVDEWKEALNEITKLKGWEKDKVAQGHEGELINVVASEICMKLGRNHVKLTDNLVGMDHHLEKMNQLLNLNCDDVRVIGIHGMGGIGKTTIAKFLYNKLGNHFQQKCSFLEDICEKVKEHRNYGVLRNQLISDILKRKPDVIILNRQTFKDTKVLIVLDDVEDRTQLSKIIENRDWLGSGSRIIVTTRNKKVFEEGDGDLIYAPKEMKFEDSLLLFCMYAFKSTQPREGYEEISREVVQTAAGLPLSLVVIGSMLFSKESKEYWEATLEKLKTIPANDVQKRLKISYDTLKHNQKQMFLDIACHFIGQDIPYAMYMWDACRFFPECEGIDVLVSLSLITIEKRQNLYRDGDYVDTFRMHDHLRDLGRDIVYQESPTDPGQRSRLWSRERAQEVLDNQSGTKKVENFYMKSDWPVSDCIISNDDFKGLSSLRYLCLDGPRLKGDFKGLVSNLRWFRWRFNDSTDLGWFWFGFGKSRTRVTNFCANKLVTLDLSESDIRDGWESWIQIKAATSLKVLKLFKCRYLTMLPECLWNMKSLVELDLSASGITILSEHGVVNLTNLTKLNLYESMIKRLPDAIGKLKKLEVLNCSYSSLEGQFPSGIGRLSSLRVLDLSCTKVDMLFEDIGSLCNLRKLNLRGTYIKKLPGVGIKRLQNLEELDCCECSLEGEVPEEIWSLSSLRVLKLSHTKITGGLPRDISGPPNLETLNLGFCKKLLLPVDELKLPLSLTKLVIPLTEASFNGIRGLVNLRVLKFQKNVGYSCELDGVDDHVMRCHLLPAMKFDSSSRLNKLWISSGTFGTLPIGSLDLSNCQGLKELRITNCPEMREIKGLEVLSSLEELTIRDCPLLMQPDLSNCQMLKDLSIHQCRDMREIKGIEVLTSLKELTVNDCPFLMEPDLSNCIMLKRLYIKCCPVMRKIKGLKVLTSLENLWVYNCPLLMEPDFSNCMRLKLLVISGCPLMREIKDLEVLTSLEYLNVQGCPLLMQPDLSNLKGLEIANWNKVDVSE